MTTEQYIASLEQRFQALKQNKPLALGVASVHALMVDRIFVKGKNSNDSQIGQYNDTKPLYASRKNYKKNPGIKGKHGQDTFKNGKKHKSGYFSSYKALRAKLGRETSFVNLALNGLLQSDFSNSLKRIDPNHYTSSVKNQANIGKVDGNEDRFGKNGMIFKLTKHEKSELVRIITVERVRLGV